MDTPGEFAAAAAKRFWYAADRLAIDARDALDLSLAGPGVQQGPDGRLQVRLQDVHSVALSRMRGRKVTSCLEAAAERTPAPPPVTARWPGRGNLRVDSGGVWVSVGALKR